jgi:hypothetical protein
MSPGETVILGLVRDGFFRIDELGRIWRTQEFGRTGKRRPVLERRAEQMRDDGYLAVRVSIAGKEHQCLAHRIVWIAANGDVPDGLEVNHKNGKRAECDLGNLDLLTKSGNVQHSYRELGHPVMKGSRNGRAKLTPEQVAEIRALHGQRASRAVAAQYGVSHTSIKRIWRGERWNEVPA